MKQRPNKCGTLHLLRKSDEPNFTVYSLNRWMIGSFGLIMHSDESSNRQSGIHDAQFEMTGPFEKALRLHYVKEWYRIAVFSLALGININSFNWLNQ